VCGDQRVELGAGVGGAATALEQVVLHPLDKLGQRDGRVPDGDTAGRPRLRSHHGQVHQAVQARAQLRLGHREPLGQRVHAARRVGQQRAVDLLLQPAEAEVRQRHRPSPPAWLSPAAASVARRVGRLHR